MWTVDTLKGEFQLPEAAAREGRELEVAGLYQLHNLEIEVKVFAGERVIGVHLDPPVVADTLDHGKEPFDPEAVADFDLLEKKREMKIKFSGFGQDSCDSRSPTWTTGIGPIFFFWSDTSGSKKILGWSPTWISH